MTSFSSPIYIPYDHLCPSSSQQFAYKTLKSRQQPTSYVTHSQTDNCKISIIMSHTHTLTHTHTHSHTHTHTHTHTRVTQVFSLFTIPVYICLTVWMCVWLFSKWQRKVDRELRGGPTERDTDELDPDKQDDD